MYTKITTTKITICVLSLFQPCFFILDALICTSDHWFVNLESSWAGMAMCFCSGTQFKSSLLSRRCSPVLSWSSTLFCLYTVWYLEAHPPAVHSVGGFVKVLGVSSPLCVTERLACWYMDTENAVDPYVQETMTEKGGTHLTHLHVFSVNRWGGQRRWWWWCHQPCHTEAPVTVNHWCKHQEEDSHQKEERPALIWSSHWRVNKHLTEFKTWSAVAIHFLEALSPFHVCTFMLKKINKLLSWCSLIFNKCISCWSCLCMWLLACQRTHDSSVTPVGDLISHMRHVTPVWR